MCTNWSKTTLFRKWKWKRVKEPQARDQVRCTCPNRFKSIDIKHRNKSTLHSLSGTETDIKVIYRHSTLASLYCCSCSCCLLLYLAHSSLSVINHSKNCETKHRIKMPLSCQAPALKKKKKKKVSQTCRNTSCQVPVVKRWKEKKRKVKMPAKHTAIMPCLPSYTNLLIRNSWHRRKF